MPGIMSLKSALYHINLRYQRSFLNAVRKVPPLYLTTISSTKTHEAPPADGCHLGFTFVPLTSKRTYRTGVVPDLKEKVLVTSSFF